MCDGMVQASVTHLHFVRLDLRRKEMTGLREGKPKP